LLQPIDVWLARAVKRLTGEYLRTENAGKHLKDLADQAGCCALLLNAGTWYFGSKIAKTEEMFNRAFQNAQSFKAVLNEHFQAVSEETRLLEALLGGAARGGCNCAAVP
jgi:hypothetical protein